jgi:hypothetical protein
MGRAAFIAMLGVLAFAGATPGVEVRQELWGFDGRVALGEFNPLSIYIHNESDKPFEGQVMLRKESAGSPLGARLIEPCYLAPGTGRWITFYPYITSQHHAWGLSWGDRRDERKLLAPPFVGQGAVAYLWTDRLIHPPGRLRAFDAARFPTTVGATAGLRTLVMDSVPQWDPLRRTAFMDWLRGGGEVHLLAPAGGSLEFAAELAELNNPQSTFRVGAGRVHRHAFTRAELDAQRLSDMGIAPIPEGGSGAWSVSAIEQGIFQSLQKIIRPEHNWPLIYLSALVFLVLVGPMNGWLSRRRISYRASLGLVCTAVILFSFAFYTIGRRGYGERTSIHKIAFARPVTEGWDVTQFANIFVTRGDRYRITHTARHNLYSTAQNHEAVRGGILAAAGGLFEVEIPIYSWRGFVHRGTFPGQPFEVHVERWPAGEGLGGLSLGRGEGYPQAVEQVLALRGDRMATLDPAGLSTTDAGQHYREALNLANYRQYSSYYQQNVYYDPFTRTPKPSPLEAIQPHIQPLIAAQLGVLHGDAPRPLTEGDHIKLFIVARAPDSFSVQGEGFGLDHGYVIYQLDLLQPTSGETP